MNDQTTHGAFINDEENAADGRSVKIDYAALAAATEPDQPGGRIVYNSGDYATDEEADAALDAFFNRIIEAVRAKS